MSVVLVTFPGAPKVSEEAIQEVSSVSIQTTCSSLSMWTDTMGNGRVRVLIMEHIVRYMPLQF